MEYPMNERPTVADYIVRRLAREGITNGFGVAGDFAFKLCPPSALSARLIAAALWVADL
jgi:indolepyruvate decarboxylase